MPDWTPTPEQDAVLHHDVSQNGRVLACPGTGKSTVAVALIERALSQEEPPRVRMLTFTRSATSELAKKLIDHPHAATVKPSTIHSFAIATVLQNPGCGDIPHPLRIADDWETENLVLADLSARSQLPRSDVRKLLAWMSAAWEALDETLPPADSQQARFVGAWRVSRRVFGYTLLSELPHALRDALRDYEDLVGVNYDLLVVDEYQDLNNCDLDVIRRLSERGSRIIAIGDDDQSIYGFRMAAPDGIRRFVAEYAPAQDYTLSVSKRCARRIVAWANFVIQTDTTRPVDHPVLHPDDPTEDGEVALLAFNSDSAEAAGIAQIVTNLHALDGIPLREILVLLRTDHNGMFSKPIRDQLLARGISCSSPDEVGAILDETRNRRLVATLRLAVDTKDSLAWATLINLESGIGPSMQQYILQESTTRNVSFGQALLDLHARNFPNAPRASAVKTKALVDRILAWIAAHPVPMQRPAPGWGTWISEIGDPVVVAASEQFGSLLRKVDIRVADDESQSLDRFLGLIGPVGKDLMSAEADGVRIMTMASSKGLTVTATIVGAVEDDIIPSRRATLPEETRLMYVAMTRARRYLYCTWARRRTGPTARAGSGRVLARRAPSTFVRHGPVASQDGQQYIAGRWLTDA